MPTMLILGDRNAVATLIRATTPVPPARSAPRVLWASSHGSSPSRRASGPPSPCPSGREDRSCRVVRTCRSARHCRSGKPRPCVPGPPGPPLPASCR
ncbi:hypothetical protein AAW14_15580 [Streptomyces hygroscopicus]|nr:hypothetical protein [Streptomyces hygroscopicus]